MTMKVKMFAELIVELANSKGLTVKELYESIEVVKGIVHIPEKGSAFEKKEGE